MPERREPYPYHAYQRPPAAPPFRMTPGMWAAAAVAAVIVVMLAGYLAWGFYQDRKAREIPVYPGASLTRTVECSSGSG